jgi:hypothetical protein
MLLDVRLCIYRLHLKSNNKIKKMGERTQEIFKKRKRENLLGFFGYLFS